MAFINKWSDGRFNRICQVPSHEGILVPPGKYIYIEVVLLPSARPSKQPKRKTDRFSRFRIAHGRKSLLYNGHPFPPKMPLPLGDLDPHLVRGSWAHPSPQPKCRLDRFVCFCNADYRYCDRLTDATRLATN